CRGLVRTRSFLSSTALSLLPWIASGRARAQSLAHPPHPDLAWSDFLRLDFPSGPQSIFATSWNCRWPDSFMLRPRDFFLWSHREEYPRFVSSLASFMDAQ